MEENGSISEVPRIVQVLLVKVEHVCHELLLDALDERRDL